MDEAQLESAIAAFKEAVRRATSQTAFEKATGAKQQNVSNWLKHGKPLPGEYVLATERTYGISRHVLRPDIYGQAAPVAANVPEPRGELEQAR